MFSKRSIFRLWVATLATVVACEQPAERLTAPSSRGSSVPRRAAPAVVGGVVAVTDVEQLYSATGIDRYAPQIARGVECLKRLMGADGAWPRQAQSGVFFATAMLDYRLYKDVFPSWALARYAAATQRPR